MYLSGSLDTDQLVLLKSPNDLLNTYLALPNLKIWFKDGFWQQFLIAHVEIDATFGLRMLEKNYDNRRRAILALIYNVNAMNKFENALFVSGQHRLLFAIEFFLEMSPKTVEYVVMGASAGGHLDVVQRYMTPDLNLNFAIRYASENGHLELLKRLIDWQKARGYEVEWRAALFVTNSIEVYNYLSPKVDSATVETTLCCYSKEIQRYVQSKMKPKKVQPPAPLAPFTITI